MIPTLNEYVQAQFVMMKFQSFGGMRQGEIQMSGGNMNVFGLENTLRLLREKDFERTLQLANGFNRPETRIWLQIQLINDALMPVNTEITTRRSFVFSNR